jgi:hypothetical protein
MGLFLERWSNWRYPNPPAAPDIGTGGGCCAGPGEGRSSWGWRLPPPNHLYRDFGMDSTVRPNEQCRQLPQPSLSAWKCLEMTVQLHISRMAGGSVSDRCQVLCGWQQRIAGYRARSCCKRVRAQMCLSDETPCWKMLSRAQLKVFSAAVAFAGRTQARERDLTRAVFDESKVLRRQ